MGAGRPMGRTGHAMQVDAEDKGFQEYEDARARVLARFSSEDRTLANMRHMLQLMDEEDIILLEFEDGRF